MFQINDEAVPKSEAFTYLGRTITYNNINWAAVYPNLFKSWWRWDMIVRVLERTRGTVWTKGEIYKAVGQSVLLFGSKCWVVNGDMLKVLMEFNHWSAR